MNHHFTALFAGSRTDRRNRRPAPTAPSGNSHSRSSCRRYGP
jgi:hypothetical protein